MECFSELFCKTICNLLKTSNNTIIATFPAKGTRFIESLKRIPNVLSYNVTSKNRSELPSVIANKVNGV